MPSTTAVLPKSSSKARLVQPSKQVRALPLQASLSRAEQEDFISAKAYEKAKQIVLEAGTGWDLRELERQFYAYATGKGKPASPDRAFLGFIRKKVQKRP